MLTENQSLEQLKTVCLQQATVYLNRREKDLNHQKGLLLHACYEIFREALKDVNSPAWTVLYELYHAQIGRWIRRISSFHYCEETIESCTNEIFNRFCKRIQALGLEAFDRSVPKLLKYLQSVTVSYVLDCSRRARRPDPPLELKDARLVDSGQLIDAVIQAEYSERLSELFVSHIKNEQERIVYQAVLLQQLKPQQVYLLYPTHFDTVKDVYRTKENLIRRMARNKELHAMFVEIFGRASFL